MLDKDTYSQMALRIKGSLACMSESKQWRDGMAMGNIVVAFVRLMPDETLRHMTEGVLKDHNSEEYNARQMYESYKGTLRALQSYCEARAGEE